MPKKAPTPFEVDGVQCTVKDGLINVGLNPGWSSSLRFPMKVKATDDITVCTEKVRMHAKFAACKMQLAEPAASSSAPPESQALSRMPLYNGSSLLRESAALRKDLDRKATALPLASQQAAADFLVFTGAKEFPHVLATMYPFSHLDGVWARRPELVNGRPAYTCAYSWASRQTQELLKSDGSGDRMALWYSPSARRFGHSAGEALPGWIIGESSRLGEGYTTPGTWMFLINTDPAPIPELIRRERRTWSSMRESGHKISGSGWLANQCQHGRAIKVQIWLKPMEVPKDICVFQRAFRDPEDGELCPFTDEFYERPTGPQPRRLFEHRCSSHRHPRKRCSREASESTEFVTEFLVRCDEVTSAIHWRRRSCMVCGASGPVDGSPLENESDVELEPCPKGCGAFFCAPHSFDNFCTQSVDSRCPHLEYTHVAPQVSNAIIAADLRLVCSCDCCLRRARKPHACDVCERLPCACQGHSGWKSMYGTFYKRVLAGESLL